MKMQMHRWPFDKIWRDVAKENPSQFEHTRALLDESRPDPAPTRRRRLLAGLHGHTGV
jgi:hypothetical protein